MAKVSVNGRALIPCDNRPAIVENRAQRFQWPSGSVGNRLTPSHAIAAGA